MPGPRTSVGVAVAVAAAFVAAVAGLAEALIRLAIYREILHRPAEGDADLLWMVPVGYLVAVAAPTVVAMTVAALSRSALLHRLGAAAILFTAAGYLVALYPGLDRTAGALLAAGLAWRGSDWLVRSWSASRLARPTAWLWLSLGVLVGVLRVGPGTIDRIRRFGRGPAAEGSPNILLVVWDTVRKKSMSLYGYRRPTTPWLDRLATNAVVFDAALATSPWTLPSHGSMFTGLWEQEQVVDHTTPLAGQHLTLAEVLRERGYATGGFVGNKAYGGREFGLAQGFDRFRDHIVTVSGVLGAPMLSRAIVRSRRFRRLTGYGNEPARKPARRVTKEALGWIERIGDRPWFAFINYFDAHSPYRPEPPFDRMFGANPDRKPAEINDTDELALAAEVLAVEQDSYDAGIASIDDATNDILDSIRRRGQLDNTVVVIVADHGEQFGEHGLMTHSNSMYTELLAVPLVVRFPARVPAGRRVATPTSLRDLPTTILDIAGLAPEPRFPGQSLARFWREPEAPASFPILAGKTTRSKEFAQAVITERWYYVAWPGKQPELYRRTEDPWLLNNLAKDTSYSGEMAALGRTRDSLEAVVRAVRHAGKGRASR